MNSITRPEYDLALETTLAVLTALKADGSNQPTLLATLRSKMFDEAFLEKQHRQTFLKRVNETLGTGWSMNQVRKADPTLLAAATSKTVAEIEGVLIPVDELHGSSVLELAGQAADSYVSNVKETWVAPAGTAQESEPSQAAPAADEPKELEQAANTQPTSTTSPEQPAMPVGKEIKQETNTNTSTTSNVKEDTMTNAAQPTAFQLHLAEVVAIGYDTQVKRDELYNAFLSANLDLQPQAQSTAKEGLGNDEQFYAFVSKTPETLVKFSKFAGEFKPARQSAEARSQFSLRGERDDGVRAGWVAVGGALLGAALETGHRGSLSIGSGIGAVAGAAGAFFAAEMLEDKIDSDFGRYTMAGTLGLAAGALGSGIGRMAQTAIVGNLSQSTEEGIPSALPAPTVSAPSVVPHSAIVGMLGFR